VDCLIPLDTERAIRCILKTESSPLVSRAETAVESQPEKELDPWWRRCFPEHPRSQHGRYSSQEERAIDRRRMLCMFHLVTTSRRTDRWLAAVAQQSDLHLNYILAWFDLPSHGIT
jgi:hypothetical protein